MKIIDAHAHVASCIAGFTANGELRSIGKGKAQYANGQIITLIPRFMHEDKVTPEDLLKVMDENNVEKAVLLQGQYLGFHNLYTYEAIKKYPTRFIGGASFDPFCVNSEQVASYLFDDLKFSIIKMEVSNSSGLMSYHKTVDLNGEIMHKIYKMANERKLTFVIDIGRPNNNSFQIEELSQAISKYPQMSFVICHLLSPQLGDYDNLKLWLQKLNFPNVYFDLASVASNVKPETYPYKTAQKHILLAKEIIGSKRLLFGSDMPSTLTKDSYHNLLNYMFDLFDENEKQDVFYNNANKIYFKR